MFFFFVCGEHTFQKPVKGFEGQTVQCHNCGNYAANIIKSNPWFTLCWVPMIPLSIKGYQEVHCNVCHFNQPLSHRQDLSPGAGGAGSHMVQPPSGRNQPPPQQYLAQVPPSGKQHAL